MLATRTDVLWIAACIFLIGLILFGGAELYARWQRKQRRDALMKRIDAFHDSSFQRKVYEKERSGRGWE